MTESIDTIRLSSVMTPWRERDDLLPHVDRVAHLVHVRREEVQAGLEADLEFPEPLHDADGLLLHDPDGLDECHDHQQGDQRQHYEECGHGTLPLDRTCEQPVFRMDGSPTIAG